MSSKSKVISELENGKSKWRHLNENDIYFLKLYRFCEFYKSNEVVLKIIIAVNKATYEKLRSEGKFLNVDGYFGMDENLLKVTKMNEHNGNLANKLANLPTSEYMSGLFTKAFVDLKYVRGVLKNEGN